MKILHVFRAPVGGLFRHVCDLSGEQAARGLQIGVIFDSSTSDALSAVRLDRLRSVCALGVHPVAMSRTLSPRDVTGIVATRRLARALGADVLHGHGAKGGAFARLAAMLEGAEARPRVFYTPHGGSLHYDPRSAAGRIYLGLERMLGRWTDGLIFESDYSAHIYAEKVGAGGTPARVVPNGLQADEFTPIEPTGGAADFLFVGELRHLKGVDVLLEAMARLPSPATVVIVGAGPDADAFRALAQRLGIADRVRFAGAMPARQAFALARVLVVPSRAESFPYIVLEAAAARLPLLTTRVGGIPEILSGTDADMVAPGDVGALARAMMAALKAPQALRARADTLRADVAARFNVQRMADSVIDFYDDVGRTAATAHLRA